MSKVSKDGIKYTTKAYIAGLIDGEGCISISRVKTPTKLPRSMTRQTYYYRPAVIMVNTERTMLDYVATAYGGKVTRIKKAERFSKDVYQWVITGKNMRRLLKDVLPYLLTKRKQARLILNFPIFPPSGYGSRRSEKMLRRQASMYDRLKELHGMGVRYNGKELRNSQKEKGSMPEYTVKYCRDLSKAGSRRGADRTGAIQCNLLIDSEDRWITVVFAEGFVSCTNVYKYRGLCKRVVDKTMDNNIYDKIKDYWKENNRECFAYVYEKGISYRPSWEGPEWYHAD